MGILRDYLNDTRAFEFKRQLMAEERARAEKEAASLYEPVQGQVSIPVAYGRAPQYDDMGRMVGPAGPPGVQLTTQGPVMPGPEEVHRRMQEAAMRLDPAVAAQLFASTRGQDVNVQTDLAMQGMRNDQSGREAAGMEQGRMQRWLAEGGGQGARPLDMANLGTQRNIQSREGFNASRARSDSELAAVLSRAGIDADTYMRAMHGAPAQYFTGAKAAADAASSQSTAMTRAAEASEAPGYYGARTGAMESLGGQRDARTETINQERDPRVRRLLAMALNTEQEGQMDWRKFGQEIEILDAQLRKERAGALEAEKSIAPRVRTLEAKAKTAEGLVDPTIQRAGSDARRAQVEANTASDLGSARVRKANADAIVAKDTIQSRTSKSEADAGTAKAKRQSAEIDAELDVELSRQERETAVKKLLAMTEGQITENELKALDLKMQEKYRDDMERAKLAKLLKVDAASVPAGTMELYKSFLRDLNSARTAREQRKVYETYYQGQLGEIGAIKMTPGTGFLSRETYSLGNAPEASATPGIEPKNLETLDLGAQ